MADEGDNEEASQEQGVVPHYTMHDLAPEPLRGGRAPWHLLASNCANRTDASDKEPALPPFRQGCPPLLIGGSALGKDIFSDQVFFQSTEPYRVVRLAFEYGLRAIDTSPFYHPSEISLGRILKALAPQFGRETYYLQTKVGRYGPTRKHFDYSPQRVRSSVQTSLARLGTTYLDSVIMHDVEFVCDAVGPSQDAGFVARDVMHKKQTRRACGLADDDDDDIDCLPAKIHGPGDAAIIAAVQTLFALKDEGVIRNVGIGGYPLPTLLRLSRLIACHPPFRPVDVIVNYCHHTLQNDLLPRYRHLFAREPTTARKRASRQAGPSSLPPWAPPTLINASPFSMGLLTDKGPPDWHPASDELKHTCIQASAQLQAQRHADGRTGLLARTAAHFGLRGSELQTVAADPHASSSPPQQCTVVGMNSVEQVHQAVDAYRVILVGAHITPPSSGQKPFAHLSADEIEQHRATYMQQKHDEKQVIDLFKQVNLLEWSWACP